jgi:hypothetical protein
VVVELTANDCTARHDNADTTTRTRQRTFPFDLDESVIAYASPRDILDDDR